MVSVWETWGWDFDSNLCKCLESESSDLWVEGALW